ncbi:MAG: hypothetical protein M0P95_12985 [Sulfuritalea sp.]|jgi:hypothetical protein|nr:hypothetical protein [Sulfuritalea sp.]
MPTAKTKVTTGKYFPCAITYALQPQAFMLSAKDVTELLADAGRNDLADGKLKTFSEHMSLAIGSYKAEESELSLRKISQIRRRLEHLRKHSLLLLTGFAKWEDIEGRNFGSGSGLSNGLVNLDEVTRCLLDDCGAKRNQLREDLLKLSEASGNSLRRLPTLPHVLPRWAEQHFIHSLAIIFRDVLDGTPTKSVKSQFTKFARRATKIAGIRNVGKDAIFKAVDALNLRNVIRTNHKIGMRDSQAIYEEIPVSFIKPHAIGKTADGKDLLVHESDWS